MSKKLPSAHPLFELKGTPRACGREYGERHAEAIEAFFHMETHPDPKRLRYAARCARLLRRWEKPVAEFARGMAEGAGLSFTEATLLLLHEEIYHTKHCTSLGATGRGTRDGAPVIAQNWDWNARLYAWPHLTRLRARGVPRALFYSFPGLWPCAGINEHGMSLAWTSAGLYPKVAPRVGIPTYALIAAILARKNCREAIALLRRTRNAGCFIFTLADARGEVWVIEGTPGRVDAIPCRDVVSRANHYEGEAACRRARQTPASLTSNSRFRGPRMARLVRRHCGKIDARRVEAFLGDLHGGVARSICQRARGKKRGLTLDSFYCLPRKREFWIARGLPTRHVFRRYRV